MIIGGSGVPLRYVFEDDRGIYHYRVVDVYENRLKITAVSLEGDVIEKFIIQIDFEYTQ